MLFKRICGHACSKSGSDTDIESIVHTSVSGENTDSEDTSLIVKHKHYLKKYCKAPHGKGKVMPALIREIQVDQALINERI